VLIDAFSDSPVLANIMFHYLNRCNKDELKHKIECMNGLEILAANDNVAKQIEAIEV
jgi:hypothetical protein